MYLKIGTIVKQVGLKGEVRVYSTTTFANKRYKKGNTLYIKMDNEYIPVTVNSYRKLNSTFDVVSFNEFGDTHSTDQLLKKEIFGIKDQKYLCKNEFYYDDLLNCQIVSNDEIVGIVIGIEEFPAQLTLKCTSSKSVIFFIPFIPEFIKTIDIQNKKIFVELIEGML